MVLGERSPGRVGRRRISAIQNGAFRGPVLRFRAFSGSDTLQQWPPLLLVVRRADPADPARVVRPLAVPPLLRARLAARRADGPVRTAPARVPAVARAPAGPTVDPDPGRARAARRLDPVSLGRAAAHAGVLLGGRPASRIWRAIPSGVAWPGGPLDASKRAARARRPRGARSWTPLVKRLSVMVRLIARSISGYASTMRSATRPARRSDGVDAPILTPTSSSRTRCAPS